MGATLKKVGIFLGLSALVALAYAGKKVTNLAYAFENMEITPYWIKKIKPGLTQTQFELDVLLKNLTDEPFNVTGATLAVLKRIEIVYNRQTIGVAHVNIGEIEIPAFGSKILTSIPTIVSTAAIVNNAQNIQDLMSKSIIVGYIEVAGTEYQIGAE